MLPLPEPSKQSWADQVEQESDDLAAAEKRPPEGGGRKKNRKKNKKKAAPDGDKDAPLQGNPATGHGKEELRRNQSWAAAKEAQSSHEVPGLECAAAAECWEVASRRRPRRSDEPQRKQGGCYTSGNSARVQMKAGAPPCVGPPPMHVKSIAAPQRSTEACWKIQGRPEIVRTNDMWHADSKHRETSCVEKHISPTDMQSFGNMVSECNYDMPYAGGAHNAYTSFIGSGNVPEPCPPQPAVNRWQQPSIDEEGSQRALRADTATNAHMFMQLFPSEKQYQKAIGTQQGPSACSGQQVQTPLEIGPSTLDDYVHSDANTSDNDLAEDTDSECLASDDFESEASNVSHETEKKNKWFKNFFESVEFLTFEELNEHRYHCPACKGGVGGIDWYEGLQPLLTHAKTVRARRVKLHQTFAKILEEELEIRGAASGANEQGIFSRWKGLNDDKVKANPVVVWPPMVVIQNTKLELDEQEKWIGMGNKELLAMFKDYNVMKARHAYGPQGHRGMSIVIFSDSPTGYIDAQRLDKHFKDSIRGRDEWDRQGKLLFLPGGDRMLYGYMANVEDMEIFNKHCSGKGRLKYRLRHLQEAVFEPMRRMDEENHKLNWLKIKVEKEQGHSKALEKTMSAVVRKLRMKEGEISVIRKRAMEQYEENEREMESLEQTFKEMLNQLASDSDRREEVLRRQKDNVKEAQIEKYEELEKKCVKISDEKHIDDNKRQQHHVRVDEQIARQSELVETSLKDLEDYEFRRKELMRKHHIRRMKFRREQYNEALAFEKELEREKKELMEKCLQEEN